MWSTIYINSVNKLSVIMGKIVWAGAASHAPQILMYPSTPAEDEVQIEHTRRALGRLKDVLYEIKPDALIVIANDHLETFNFDNYPAFCIYVGPECVGTFGENTYKFKSHEELAKTILFECIEAGFDLAFSQNIGKLQHAHLVPLHYTLPEQDIPLVLLFVNCCVAPQPTSRRCYELGKTIDGIIRHRLSAGERIAVLATGGLSHYTGTPRYGEVDGEFDAKILKLMSEGQGSKLADISQAELDRTGSFELRNWITLLGAIGDVKAEVLTYQPSWHCAYAVVYWKLVG